MSAYLHPHVVDGVVHLSVVNDAQHVLGSFNTQTSVLHPNPPTKYDELRSAFLSLMPGCEPATALIDLAAQAPGAGISHKSGANFRAGAIAEQRTAGMLTALLSRGWHLINSVPLTPFKDVDHLLVGPAGVFAINTKSSKYNVEIFPDGRMTAYGHAKKWWSESCSDAERVSTYLSEAMRYDVPVHAMIVVWSGENATITGNHPLIVRGDDLVDALRTMPVTYSPTWVDAVFATARRADTWNVHHDPADIISKQQRAATPSGDVHPAR